MFDFKAQLKTFTGKVYWQRLESCDICIEEHEIIYSKSSLGKEKKKKKRHLAKTSQNNLDEEQQEGSCIHTGRTSP